jgi:hypothetical protein
VCRGVTEQGCKACQHGGLLYAVRPATGITHRTPPWAAFIIAATSSQILIRNTGVPADGAATSYPFVTNNQASLSTFEEYAGNAGRRGLVLDRLMGRAAFG